MVNSMASSTGDVLIYDSSTPGGARFLNHVANPTTLNKINADNWDYVVLQAQSQEAGLSQNQMNNQVFPHAMTLSNLIRQNNECSQPLFYMTWGRENGDPTNCQSMPWVCTYEGMDDVIRSSYLFMAEQNDAELAPAGAVWRYLRTNYPSINLYQLDESHPSLEGSYAAACALYTMIYKKDPTLITWNSTLSASVANTIKLAAKTIVFDEIASWDFTINPAEANFSEDIQDATVAFTNTSADFESVLWDFGDGTSSTEENPTHTYTADGTYTVSLTVIKCGKSGTIEKDVAVTVDLGVNNLSTKSLISVFPNPTNGVFQVKFDDNSNKAKIEIYDMKGSMLMTKEVVGKSLFEMNIGQLNSGLYFLKVTTEESTFFTKVLKN